MKVGIIGCGNIAKIHSQIISQISGTEIVAVADRHFTEAKRFASDLKLKKVYQDPDLMIKEEKPDVVHVLTPPQNHAEFSVLAMHQGCHVFVEKPMATNSGDAKKMIEVSKQKKVHLCVNHNMVFSNLLRKAKELITAGFIGLTACPVAAAIPQGPAVNNRTGWLRHPHCYAFATDHT